eukprot:scaffold202988_cov18-Tisochrysis_lutea.AAC.1
MNDCSTHEPSKEPATEHAFSTLFPACRMGRMPSQEWLRAWFTMLRAESIATLSAGCSGLAGRQQFWNDPQAKVSGAGSASLPTRQLALPTAVGKGHTFMAHSRLSGIGLAGKVAGLQAHAHLAQTAQAWRQQ